MLYSQSAEELLKRKKVFREIIFKYLATKGVIVPPSSEKHQLIYRTKEYWCEGLEVCASEQTYTNPSIQVRYINNKQCQKYFTIIFDYWNNNTFKLLFSGFARNICDLFYSLPASLLHSNLLPEFIDYLSVGREVLGDFNLPTMGIGSEVAKGFIATRTTMRKSRAWHWTVWSEIGGAFGIHLSW